MNIKHNKMHRWVYNAFISINISCVQTERGIQLLLFFCFRQPRPWTFVPWIMYRNSFICWLYKKLQEVSSCMAVWPYTTHNIVQPLYYSPIHTQQNHVHDHFNIHYKLYVHQMKEGSGWEGVVLINWHEVLGICHKNGSQFHPFNKWRSPFQTSNLVNKWVIFLFNSFH